jgi:hypothetical protein
MTEIEQKIKRFHGYRRMFLLNPNGFIYTIRHVANSHQEWAEHLKLPENALDTWGRGYFWDATNHLYFYVGSDTTVYEPVIPTIKRVLPELLVKVGGNHWTTICGGMIPGEPGTVWKPVRVFTNQDLI